MYPFHRQHQHRSRVPHTGPHAPGRHARSRSNKEEWRSGSEPPSPTHDPPSPSRSRHQRTCEVLGLDLPSARDNALRAKKNVLLSSLYSAASGWGEPGNKRRLGPNRYNVFESLTSPKIGPTDQQSEHRSSSIPREQSESKCNLVHTEQSSPIQTENSEPKCSPVETEQIERKCNPVHTEQTQSKCSPIQTDSYQHVSPNLQENVTSLDKYEKVLPLEPEPQQVVVSNPSKDSDNVPSSPVPENIQEMLSLQTIQDIEDLQLMELVDEDIVSDFLDISVPNTPINLLTAIDLKKVILGSATEHFSPQWLGQSFIFNAHHKLRYGFVQKKGGCCGVLATIQAFVLKTLLFEQRACNCTEPLRPTRIEANAALVRAIGDVLWRAGLGDAAVLALCSDCSHLETSSKYSQDGLTEKLNLTSFSTRELLEAGIKKNLDQFTDSTGNGCLLLLFSAVLSRGLHRVRNDMDEYSPLIGHNGQCTLELVNLLLTGYAVSNVFDNNLQVDSCWLRGVNTRADIGLLSLFEHYNSCQVGSYLKTPRFPIWVVCSENHFSVLFSCRRELVSDWRAERRFHLYYYDGMARQEDEIKLTVDTTGLHCKKHNDSDRVPPLEHCIRTKWKDAVVDWNGYHPIH